MSLGWRSEPIPHEFRLEDAAKLRATYEISQSVKIQIPSLTILDKDTLLEGWITLTSLGTS